MIVKKQVVLTRLIISTICKVLRFSLIFRYLQNCTPQAVHPWLSILWVIILLVLLSLLASTADDYFCVVMDSVVEKLRIPPSVAGIIS